MVELSIVLPTFNEAESIARFLWALEEVLETLPLQSEIVVVDDDSPDGTAGVVREYAKKHPRVRLIVRTENHGLGLSILDGFRGSTGKIFIGMDADFNHDPAVIKDMLRALESADLVVASRFVSGGGMSSAFRQTTSWGFNALLRALFGFRVWDNTSGYYAIAREKLFTLEPEKIYYGYGDYHLRLVWFAQKKDYRIKEIPVFYGNRVAGVSKSRFLKMMSSYFQEAWKLSRSR